MGVCAPVENPGSQKGAVHVAAKPFFRTAANAASSGSQAHAQYTGFPPNSVATPLTAFQQPDATARLQSPSDPVPSAADQQYPQRAPPSIQLSAQDPQQHGTANQQGPSMLGTIVHALAAANSDYHPENSANAAAQALIGTGGAARPATAGAPSAPKAPAAPAAPDPKKGSLGPLWPQIMNLMFGTTNTARSRGYVYGMYGYMVSPPPCP